MNKKTTYFFLLISLFVLSDIVYAQKYWVKFANKNGTPFSVSNPSAFLSAKSIQRRTNQGIAVNSTDLPVTPSYVSQVDAVSGVTILYRSKWMNGVVISVTNTVALTTINSFSFVSSSNKVNRYKIELPVIDENQNPNLENGNAKTASPTAYSYGPSGWQAKMLGIDCMHNLGFRGQGMTIAVIDDGFASVNTNPIFDSLFMENRLLGCRDFVTGDTMVFEDDTHGAYVLSTMAANKPGLIVGTAPKAKYWLLRSEDVFSETISEEYNWIRAAEFADSVGADICTTSLGYTTFDGGLNDHTYANLNGKTAPMSIAATMAARKGMVILNAAGNEGGNSWHFIAVPADADSICTVGAVDSLKVKASFSSFGPTSDSRIKPDVCARGQAAYVCGPGSNCFYGNGTSFATPIMAGAIACLWQAKPTLGNIQLLNLVKQYASNTLTPDNNIGWGIPNMCVSYNPASGIDEINTLDGISVYPNPAKAQLNIKTTARVNSISLFDVLGKEIKLNIINEGMVHTLDVSSLSNGIYFIRLSQNDKTITKKFVKE